MTILKSVGSLGGADCGLSKKEIVIGEMSERWGMNDMYIMDEAMKI
mgnify:CR=1 FL=1